MAALKSAAMAGALSLAAISKTIPVLVGDADLLLMSRRCQSNPG